MDLHFVPEKTIFHHMWNKGIYGTSATGEIPSERELISIAVELIRKSLPPTWSLQLAPEPHDSQRNRILDALLEIESNDGTKATVGIEVKRRVEPGDVPRVLAQIRSSGNAEAYLVTAPFLSKRTRELLAEANVSYADAMGNLRLHLDRPLVFIMLPGAETNPWREIRSLSSLKGPTAGRVVRALCDFRPPYGIRDLADRSGTPASSVSRVVQFLEREAFLTRAGRGAVVDVDWPGLIRRWADDYSLVGSNQTRTFLEPRGLDAFIRKLTAMDRPYAVTGSIAAARVAPVAPSRLAIVYVDDVREAGNGLGLRQTDRGANVMLALPYDSVVFDRTTKRDGIACAALSQVAADLLTSPGRGPAEGEELIRWMEANENDWRL